MIKLPSPGEKQLQDKEQKKKMIEKKQNIKTKLFDKQIKYSYMLLLVCCKHTSAINRLYIYIYGKNHLFNESYTEAVCKCAVFTC